MYPTRGLLPGLAFWLTP